jgi:hypothetical protein
LVPSARTPSAIWTALLGPQRKINAKLPAAAALASWRAHPIQRDCADQIRRDLNAVEITQIADDLTRAHAAGVHLDNLVIEPREAGKWCWYLMISCGSKRAWREGTLTWNCKARAKPIEEPMTDDRMALVELLQKSGEGNFRQGC